MILTNVDKTQDNCLRPCPFCGGDVSFHRDEECPGCHLIECGQCRAYFDFATGADPGNDCETVDALRAAIAPMWNARGQLAPIEGWTEEREAFEADIRKLYPSTHLHLLRRIGEDYQESYIVTRWEGWQAGAAWQRAHAQEEAQRLRDALEEIADPIKFMRARLEDGEQLNGVYAIQMAESGNYLREIAKRAIAAITEED